MTEFFTAITNIFMFTLDIELFGVSLLVYLVGIAIIGLLISWLKGTKK